MIKTLDSFQAEVVDLIESQAAFTGQALPGLGNHPMLAAETLRCNLPVIIEDFWPLKPPRDLDATLERLLETDLGKNLPGSRIDFARHLTAVLATESNAPE